MESWKILFQNPGFSIQPARTKLEVSGPTAICRCLEQVGVESGTMDSSSSEGAATASFLEAINVYQRENGQWKISLHMATPVAIMPPSDLP